MDAKPTDRNSFEYKMKYNEAGKGFIGGGKKLTKEGRKNFDEIDWSKKRGH